MSFKIKRPNRAQRREDKRRAWEESVKQEAVKHPVYVTVTKHVPARPPIAPENLVHDGRGEIIERRFLNERPDHRVIELPVRDRYTVSAYLSDPRSAFLRTERFKSIQYRCRASDTEFVWWVWEPMSHPGWKPEVIQGQRRAHAVAHRIRGFLPDVLRYVPAWMAKEFAEWIETVIEDTAENLGMP